jgi:hypothetical protein
MGKLLLKAVGGPFTENIYDEIQAITDRAELDTSLIEYDEVSGCVVIPLTRFPVLPGQRKVFRKVTQYKQDKKAIPCAVTIRNIKSMGMTSHLEEDEDSKINLIFGIAIENTKILLTSVQEDRGKIMFVLTIEIDSLDIEIRDV